MKNGTQVIGIELPEDLRKVIVARAKKNGVTLQDEVVFLAMSAVEHFRTCGKGQDHKRTDAR